MINDSILSRKDGKVYANLSKGHYQFYLWMKSPGCELETTRLRYPVQYR